MTRVSRVSVLCCPGHVGPICVAIFIDILCRRARVLRMSQRVGDQLRGRGSGAEAQICCVQAMLWKEAEGKAWCREHTELLEARGTRKSHS